MGAPSRLLAELSFQLLFNQAHQAGRAYKPLFLEADTVRQQRALTSVQQWRPRPMGDDVPLGGIVCMMGKSPTILVHGLMGPVGALTS